MTVETGMSAAVAKS